MLLKKLPGLGKKVIIIRHKTLKKNTPLAFSLISSSAFSSSTRTSCSFGIFSWSLGIRFLESSHSFVKSLILDESCIKTQVRYICPHKQVNPFITNLLKLSSNFLIFCFTCFKSSLCFTSCLSNSLNFSLHSRSSLSRPWSLQRKRKQNDFRDVSHKHERITHPDFRQTSCVFLCFSCTDSSSFNSLLLSSIFSLKQHDTMCQKWLHQFFFAISKKIY